MVWRLAGARPITKTGEQLLRSAKQARDTARGEYAVKCMACQGYGKIWIDPRDAYEGDKLRRFALCELCAGNGVVSRGKPAGIASQAYWDAVKAEEDAAKATAEAQKMALQAATDKLKKHLTVEEIKLLGLKLEELT